MKRDMLDYNTWIGSLVSNFSKQIPMEGEERRNYSPLDFGFTFVGLLVYLSDIVLDVLAVMSFYRDGDLVYLGLLVSFLVGSSVLGQWFSWFWYKYDKYKTHTRVEGCVNRVALCTLHFLQLGVYLRYFGVLEVAVRSFRSRSRDPENLAVYLANDLAMLRIIETFSESAPQLVLMLTVMLNTGHWKDAVTMLKVLGSASAIACSVTLYHRSLRSFLPDKAQQNFSSSLLYFTWNLLLIFPRLAALALFACVMPCHIFAHFLCSWAMLVFFVWRCKSTFMDSTAGEWLYRATVGLIWYFCWFNVCEGSTLRHGLLYHAWMLADLGLLCGLAVWMTHNAPDHSRALPFDVVAILGGSIVAVYLLGLLVKVLYYRFSHPTLGRSKEQPLSGVAFSLQPNKILSGDVTDSGQASEQESDSSLDCMDRSMPGAAQRVEKRENRRMKHLAQNFYS